MNDLFRDVVWHSDSIPINHRLKYAIGALGVAPLEEHFPAKMLEVYGERIDEALDAAMLLNELVAKPMNHTTGVWNDIILQAHYLRANRRFSFQFMLARSYDSGAELVRRMKMHPAMGFLLQPAMTKLVYWPEDATIFYRYPDRWDNAEGDGGVFHSITTPTLLDFVHKMIETAETYMQLTLSINYAARRLSGRERFTTATLDKYADRVMAVIHPVWGAKHSIHQTTAFTSGAVNRCISEQAQRQIRRALDHFLMLHKVMNAPGNIEPPIALHNADIRAVAGTVPHPELWRHL